MWEMKLHIKPAFFRHLEPENDWNPIPSPYKPGWNPTGFTNYKFDLLSCHYCGSCANEEESSWRLWRGRTRRGEKGLRFNLLVHIVQVNFISLQTKNEHVKRQKKMISFCQSTQLFFFFLIIFFIISSSKQT